MTKEDKQILLQDLSGRLSYGVKVSIPELQQDQIFTLTGITQTYIIVEKSNVCEFDVPINLDFKPYLRPMSSITNEELHEVQEILGKGVEIREEFIVSVDSSIDTFTYLELQAVFDWFNAHHFDVRNLIRRGLALETPKGMYN